jgi:hypothetical protein
MKFRMLRGFFSQLQKPWRLSLFEGIVVQEGLTFQSKPAKAFTRSDCEANAAKILPFNPQKGDILWTGRKPS